jgi:gluconokinase
MVYFGRMLDKIRIKARGALPGDYNTGTRDWYDFDSRCTRFLRVRYPELLRRTLAGGSGAEVLRWCFRKGRRPGPEEFEIWNAFMAKRGRADATSRSLQESKRRAGLQGNDAIVTWFGLFDADEGRKGLRPGPRSGR